MNSVVFSCCKRCGILILIGLASIMAQAQLPAQLTVQEALYPGAPTSGISRNQDPVTVGLPLADAAGVNSTAQLSLQGANLGQFRVLGRWPSGNIKWVLVDTEANLSAGGKNTGISLTMGGTGNFGGSDLATDNGSTITVNTGVAQFTIRKANFDVFDQVVVGGKTVVASGSSSGLVVMGPASPGTSCNPGPCTTPYLSRNDASSTAVIEENGPVRAVIRAEGVHRDAGGNAYLRFRVRMQFYYNKSYVKVTSMLRNADEGGSSSFNSAAKGFTSYEVRLTPSLAAGSKQFAFGSDTGTTSGTFSSTENAYLYQAYSNDMENQYWNGSTCPYGSSVPRCIASYITRTGSTAPYTYAQDGYEIVHGSSVLASGDHAHYPQGWADVADSTGAGIEIGVYQMSAYWPKSLQIQSGGAEVRIGIWPDQTLSTTNPGAAIPYYQAWPQYSIHDLYFNFHSAALSSPASEFLKFQHYLLARAPRAYYNNAQVFFYPLLDPVEEDNYWTSVAAHYGFQWSGKNPAVTDKTPQIYRFYAWQAPGGSNQSEVRLGYLQQFLARGLTGRYLTASHFYRYQTEQAFPRSDMNAAGTAAFTWRTHSPGSDVDGFGFPSNITSANSAYAIRSWVDQEHAHWYGMVDYYFLTGDETVKEQLLDGVGDRFLNPNASLDHGYLWVSRAVGAQLMGLARYQQFLSAIGDAADLSAAQGVSDATLKVAVFPDICVSGYPVGCDPTVMPYRGVSRVRGMASGGNDVGSDNNCAVGGGTNIRCAKPWMMAIEEEGMWEMAQVRGPSWPNNQTGAANPYQLILDLAYGMANWSTHEDFVMGTSYSNSGLKYDLALDYANPMTPPTAGTDSLEQFEFNYFILGKYDGQLTPAERQQLELTYLHMAAGTTFTASKIDDQDMYISSAALDVLLHPSPFPLTSVPLTVTNNGGGSYTLSWTVPSGAQALRVKMANKPIVDWIGFNPKTNLFIGNPAQSENWFAATEVTADTSTTCPPAPGTPGTTQTCTISGLSSAQPWYFAMKASSTAPPTEGAPDFSISTSAPSITLSAGQSATLTVNVGSLGGFDNPVSLSCSNVPANVTCSFSPSTVAPGSTVSTATLTVSASASAAARYPRQQSYPFAWLPFSAVGVLGLLKMERKNRRRKLDSIARLLAVLVLIAILTFSLIGCGGGSTSASNQPPGGGSGNPTILVTGSSGALVHSVPVTVTIN